MGPLVPPVRSHRILRTDSKRLHVLLRHESDLWLVLLFVVTGSCSAYRKCGDHVAIFPPFLFLVLFSLLLYSLEPFFYISLPHQQNFQSFMFRNAHGDIEIFIIPYSDVLQPGWLQPLECFSRLYYVPSSLFKQLIHPEQFRISLKANVMLAIIRGSDMKTTVNDATKKTPTTHDVEERVNVWNRYGESDANGPVVPVVPLGPKALKERHRSAIKVSRCPIERQENCENMALKTTDTTEKAPTMEESVGQKKLCH
ncbi:hypothetical protein T07_7015 [Trichinella nelsoni]|uniref:Uncharacterized protein n=1 Tax=Trichinella nelsoni TaxID=6336 RepID=A0A0V0RDN0_9BILA|nr:hypothetical protein T07_7015 [Trichinella nelsoni]